jgi:hypothetical protein
MIKKEVITMSEQEKAKENLQKIRKQDTLSWRYNKLITETIGWA